MIVAVPEESTGRFSGLGIPAYTATLVWYRWRCTTCGESGQGLCSLARAALIQGDYHEAKTGCGVWILPSAANMAEVGQLVLFELVAA